VVRSKTSLQTTAADAAAQRFRRLGHFAELLRAEQLFDAKTANLRRGFAFAAAPVPAEIAVRGFLTGNRIQNQQAPAQRQRLGRGQSAGLW